jgi:hypothetical protein
MFLQAFYRFGRLDHNHVYKQNCAIPFTMITVTLIINERESHDVSRSCR